MFWIRGVEGIQRIFGRHTPDKGIEQHLFPYSSLRCRFIDSEFGIVLQELFFHFVQGILLVFLGFGIVFALYRGSVPS